MKINLLFLMLLGLGLSACKKEETVSKNLEISQPSSIVLKGHNYELDYVKRGLAKLLGIPKEQLIYQQELKSFKYEGFFLTFDPVEYIDNIEILKKEGYEF